jgi:hypothetical protein
MSKVMRAAATAALLLTVFTGCVTPVAAGRVYVRIGPPVPIVEVRGVAPGPGFVWIDGFYRWDAGRYMWMAGRWERPPRAHARWVRGQWHHSRHGWYWVDGHWR